MGSVWDKASDNAHLKWDLCEAQAAAMHTSGGIRVEMWGKRKRLQDLEPFLWAGTDSNCRSREATDLQSARFNHLPTYPKFWASCRIRTNDPEITNHVLWPTELKRRVGKLLVSRRYNQLPLLRSRPGGFEGSWPCKTCPSCLKAGAKVGKKSELCK